MVINLPKKYFSILINSNGYYLVNKITGEFYDFYDSKIKILEQENNFSVFSDNKEIFQNLFEIANETDLTYNQRKLDDNKILRLALNISQNCLLNCVYCYASYGTYGNVGLMSEEILTKGVNFFLENFDIEGIQLFGGEPLLNLELIDLLFSTFSKQKNSKIKLSLITSLYVPDDKMNKFINILERYDKKINLEIVVSVDGPKVIHNTLRPQKNDKRKKDTYETVLKNIEMLRKFQQPKAVEITYTMLHYKNNIKIIDLYQFFIDNFKIYNLIVVPVNVQKRTALYYDAIDFSKQILETTIKLVEKVKLGINLEKHEKVFLTYVLTKIFSYNNNEIINYFCPAGVNSFIIDVEGNIYPCQLVIGASEHKIANLLLDSQSEIINKIKKYKLKVENYSNKEKYQECTECYFTYTCNRCVYKEFGSSQELFIQCEYDRRLFEFLVQNDPWNLVNLLNIVDSGG